MNTPIRMRRPLSLNTDAKSGPIPAAQDPFEIIDALCEAGEWDLARRVARTEDARQRL